MLDLELTPRSMIASDIKAAELIYKGESRHEEIGHLLFTGERQHQANCGDDCSQDRGRHYSH
jgi:hypothetical protein